MSDIKVQQMPAFKKVYKKLPKAHKKVVNNAIRVIIADYKAGTLKKGDLSGVFVYKFKIDHQLYLIAYESSNQYRLLLSLGAHENFYRDLKKK